MVDKKFGEVLVLIPARGGSKSVPRKNIVPLMGKPMIAWTIEVALASKYVSRVVVTTDDHEIAKVARSYGAEVPFIRPIDLSEDFSVDVEFYTHALNWLNDNESYLPDMIVNLRPTCPLRNSVVVDEAIEKFSAHPEADSLRSVHLASQSPFKMWTIDKQGCMHPAATLAGVEEAYNQPRQKLPSVYWQDGYVDITRTDVVLAQNSTTGRMIIPFIIEEPAVDVDYPDELRKVEAQLRERHEALPPGIAQSNSSRFPS